MGILLLAIGLTLGATVAWVIARLRLGSELTRLELEVEHERATAAEKVSVLTDAREQLSTQLQAMCSEALRGNSEQFMQLAKTQFEQLRLTATHDLDSRQKAVENLVAPIKESLEKVGTEVKTLEAARRQDLGQLDRKSTRLNSSHMSISYAV